MTDMVKIASGKEVPVGSTGTAQDGKYDYIVLPDGSVFNMTTGIITGDQTRNGMQATADTQQMRAELPPPTRNGFGPIADPKADILAMMDGQQSVTPGGNLSPELWAAALAQFMAETGGKEPDAVMGGDDRMQEILDELEASGQF